MKKDRANDWKNYDQYKLHYDRLMKQFQDSLNAKPLDIFTPNLTLALTMGLTHIVENKPTEMPEKALGERLKQTLTEGIVMHDYGVAKDDKVLSKNLSSALSSLIKSDAGTKKLEESQKKEVDGTLEKKEDEEEEEEEEEDEEEEGEEEEEEGEEDEDDGNSN